MFVLEITGIQDWGERPVREVDSRHAHIAHKSPFSRNNRNEWPLHMCTNAANQVEMHFHFHRTIKIEKVQLSTMLSTSTAHNNTRSITCVISDHIRKKPQPKTTPAHQGMKTSSAELHSLNNPLEAVHVSLRRLTLDESSYPLKKGINSRNYADKADVERIRNETLKLL